MKRVNIRNGLKQRMNEILGSDYGTEGDVPGITAWSIQAAMIDNLRRIASGIVGDSPGRPMKGLWISKNSALNIAISAGHGFTPNGDTILVSAAITSDVDSANGTKYVYLRHKMGVVDGDVYDDGKKTNFIGKLGTQNIVYDDFAASKKNTVTSFASEIITISPTIISGDPDLIYLGSVEVDAADITEVINSKARGLAPNTPTGKYRLPGVDVTENSTFNAIVEFLSAVTMSSTLVVSGAATFNGGITASGQAGVTDTNLEVGDGSGGSKTIKFQNGIYIGPA